MIGGRYILLIGIIIGFIISLFRTERTLKQHSHVLREIITRQHHMLRQLTANTVIAQEPQPEYAAIPVQPQSSTSQPSYEQIQQSRRDKSAQQQQQQAFSNNRGGNGNDDTGEGGGAGGLFQLRDVPGMYNDDPAFAQLIRQQVASMPKG